MKRFGKYLLLDKISTGGMADVYRAKLVGIRGFTKTIAIKRIHPHLLERKRFLRMFTDEAKIASRLMHPNVVQIYDLGEEEEMPYIAMEYVAGRDLFRVVQRLVSQQQRCPWRLATRVIAETCTGLHYAHEFRSLDGQPQEIVHRDVSPRNILISYSGEVKLTDFGIARAKNREEHTEHGVIKGKVRYISPEGAAGARVDGRSDIYSLGVVLAEMMTMAPFREAPNDMAMLLDIRQGGFDRSRIANLPEPIQRVLERVLAADPAHRYPDANAFREDLLKSVDDASRPMSDVELKMFMERLYADEIEAERDGELRAEQMSRDRSCTRRAQQAPWTPPSNQCRRRTEETRWPLICQGFPRSRLVPRGPKTWRPGPTWRAICSTCRWPDSSSGCEKPARPVSSTSCAIRYARRSSSRTESRPSQCRMLNVSSSANTLWRGAPSPGSSTVLSSIGRPNTGCASWRPPWP